MQKHIIDTFDTLSVAHQASKRGSKMEAGLSLLGLKLKTNSQTQNAFSDGPEKQYVRVWVRACVFVWVHMCTCVCIKVKYHGVVM